MARLNTFLLLIALATIVTAQRNRPFPTTKQPSTTESVSDGSTTTTQKSWPYAPAGFRPGRAFELPTEEKTTAKPPTPSKPTWSYGPPTRDARAMTPAPTTTTTTTTTTAKPHHSYGPPARGGRAFTPPPATDPLPTYLPPADKYGPPEDNAATTTIEPELSEPTTPKVPMPRNLGNGFYFIRLPNGFISRSGFLSASPSETNNVTAVDDSFNEVETFEPVNPSTSSNPPIPAVAVNSGNFPATPISPNDPALHAVQIQPVFQTQQRSVQYWPPQQPQTLVPAVPEIVQSNPEYVTVQAEPLPITSQPVFQSQQRTIQSWPSRLPEKLVAVQPVLRNENIVETYDPVYYVQPQAYSYTSQYRSW